MRIAWLLLLTGLACTPVVAGPADIQGEAITALSDRHGTSFGIHTVVFSGVDNASLIRLEVRRHDGSLTPVEVKGQNELGKGRLQLEFDPIDANEGVRLDRFRGVFQVGKREATAEAAVRYEVEIDFRDELIDGELDTDPPH